MWVRMNALCKPSLGAPSHVTKILQAKNGQKVDEFELIYLGNYTDIDEKWFVVFEHTNNRLSFGYVRLPQGWGTCGPLFILMWPASEICYSIQHSIKTLNVYVSFEKVCF